MDAATLIELLELQPHPEGGWYRETWRAASLTGERPSGSAIYFLLARGGRSRRHRIDAAEIWHHYLGDPVALQIDSGGRDGAEHILGPDFSAGQRPQIVVPAGAWQQAQCLGEFSLVGCTVSPAFVFEGFDLDDGDSGPRQREVHEAERRF